jgi:RecA-family ATPase
MNFDFVDSYGRPQGEDYQPKPKPKQRQTVTIAHTASQWIEKVKGIPAPLMLFSEFWHEGELCILFADTNLGKSLLAVQIADSISKGIPIQGFKLEAQAQPVVYFDFEMSAKQFEKRYSNNYQNHYQFSDRLIRMEIDPETLHLQDFEDHLFYSIEETLRLYNAKILILDNLTYLKAQTTETAKEALPLMKRLKELKQKLNLSVLALAHTPKRNPQNPITKNDLAGSKHLSNFADSLFALGESQQDKSHRYLKQLKARATEIVYDADNIALCRIHQPHNFLGFEYLKHTHEKEHLAAPTGKEALNQQILDLKEAEPELNNNQIGKRLNVHRSTVGRVLARNGLE